MLDSTKTQSEGRNKEGALQLANKMAKLPWVHGRGLDTFYPRRACNSSIASRPAVRYLKERLVKFQCSTRSMVQEFLGPVIAHKGPPKVYYP